jgi:hypothetical protein
MIKNKDRDPIVSHRLGYLPVSITNFEQLSKLLIEDGHTTTSGGTGSQIHLLVSREDTKATSTALADEVSPDTSYDIPTPTAKWKKRLTKKVKVEKVKAEEVKAENGDSEASTKSGITVCTLIVRSISGDLFIYS